VSEWDIQVQAKPLSDLMLGLGVYSQDTMIYHLCDDTRKLRFGDAFLCLPRVVNKERMIQSAIDQGANAVIVVGELHDKLGVPSACLPDMDAAGLMLRRWFETEQTSVQCVGITGTDGKTSTAWMLREVLEKHLAAAWSVGTLGWMRNKENTIDLGNTTPSLLRNHGLLALAEQHGVRALVFEVSSHGIAQARIAGLPFVAAVWTTIGHDHLEDHGSYENYLSMKHGFIQSVAQAGGVVVANADYADITQSLSAIQDDVLWYGTRGGVGLQWSVTDVGVQLRDKMQTIGLQHVPRADFHAENLAAVALVMQASFGVPLDRFACLAGHMSTPRGRLEPVSDQVYIDYAHTAEGLQRCLLSARKLTQDKLLLVFGCGGNRDKSKRPEMGAVAEKLADECWLTSDNPRDEQQKDIVADVLAGMKRPEKIHVVEDRSQAIHQAVAALLPQDVLVIAGKGHEPYMEVQGQRIPWSDQEEVCKALAIREAQACV